MMLSLPIFTALASATALIAPLPEVARTPASAAPAPQATALRATKVHVGDGTVLENGVVVMENGLVVSIGETAPDGVSVVEVEGEIAPGFIAMRDATGAGRENNETTRPFTPTADVSRAFDPDHPAWAHLLAEGVTTVVMTPRSSRIAGGLDAVVSPAHGKVLKRGAALHLGLSSRALSNSVEPTSYAGLYSHLDRRFAEATDGSPFAMAKAGDLRVMMEAYSRVEVSRALGFSKAHGLVGAIVGASQADDFVDEIKASGLGVVFEPFRPGAARNVIDSVLALQGAGVPYAFAADASTAGPASFRMTAAACMRAGLDANHALSAMTKSAADLLGLSESHGTLAAGKVADLVVWSGAPTELTSRIHSVYAGGELVHSASH